MIKSHKEGPIVYMEIEGAFSAAELAQESEKWVDTKEGDMVGFLVDITKLTKHPAIEQRKAEAEFKQKSPDLLRAIVGNDDAAARFIKIYMRFTKADRMKFFTNQAEAKEWMLSFQA